MSTPPAGRPDPTTPAPPDPVVRVENPRQLVDDLVLIPDHSVPLVPNIGVIGGRDAVLVVDTGLGDDNARSLLDYVQHYAGSRRIYLTTTHMHPEHASGAAAFHGHGTYVVNRSQAEEMAEKAAAWLRMFGGLGEPVSLRAEHASVGVADVVYDSVYDLDLGGRVVQLRATGRAHTRGDEIVMVPDVGVMFTGDLVEAGQFPIFPWLPGHDTDVSGQRWLAVLDDLIGRAPATVVPGHGPAGGIALLTTVADYLQLIREQVRLGMNAAQDRDTVVARATELAVEAHPEWHGREWIAPAVDSLRFDLSA